MSNAIFRTMLSTAALAASVIGAPLAAQHSDPYPKDLPAALVKQATVSEPMAAKTAIARVPKGRIQAVELEAENGRLIYSYEIKVAGRKGIEEVNVNAKTGAVVSTEHETPATEKREAKEEAKSPKKG